MRKPPAIASLAFCWAAFAGAAVPDYATLISHRGESQDAPENTLPAFRLAAERGFGFECDIYLSRDGRVFTCHDTTLARTSGGADTNRCMDAYWVGELENLDVGGFGQWAGSQYAGTRPALLEEVLELAADGRFIYIEVKSDAGVGIVPYVKDIFDAQTKATPSNALFITFSEPICRALKEQMPDYKVYLLKSGQMSAENLVAKLRDLGVDGVDYGYDANFVTAKFISAVRSAGFEFHAWTIDNIDRAMEAFRRGAQTVTTNRAKGLRDEYGGYLERCAAFRPEDYVQDGLVLHLDGLRNAGADAPHDDAAATWTDLARGDSASFTSGDATSGWTDNGFSFGGATYAELAAPRALTNAVTVQVVCDVDTNALVGTTTWPTLAGAGDADACNLYYDQNNGRSRLTFKNANGGNVWLPTGTWDGRFVTAIRDGATNWIFQGMARADGASAAATTANIGTALWRVGSSRVTSGNGDGLARRFLKGTINALRVYDRPLSDAELLRNRMVDKVRLFGIDLPVTNVVVASSVRGVSGNEPDGAYAFFDGPRAFSAPARATIGGVTYACTGYTLETWDGSAWGAPVLHSGAPAAEIAVSSAPVRLTWQWRVASRLTKVGDYDVGNYVQDGLVLHFDGIRNAGADAPHDDAAATWANLGAGGHVFDAAFGFNLADAPASGWAADGYVFTHGGKFAKVGGLPYLGNTVTIQIVCDVGAGTAKWPSLFGAINDFCNIYTFTAGNHLAFKIFNNSGGGRVELAPANSWTGKYANAIWQTGQYALFQTATPGLSDWRGRLRGNWKEFKGQPFCIGGIHYPNSEGNTNDRRLNGKIHALRVYDRALSDAELERNRMVDEARFFGNPPEANVVVVDCGGEQAENGAYRVDSEWAFTATTAANGKGGQGRVAGYTIETWADGAWTNMTRFKGASYTYSESSGKVRLTWRAESGSTVFVLH